MKKIIIAALIASMTISLCACDIPFIIYTGESDDQSSFVSATADTKDTAEKKESQLTTDTSASSAASSGDTSSEHKNTSSKKTTSSKAVSSQNDSSSEYEVIPIEIESEPTGFESEIQGTWKAGRILDPTGHPISGEELYGTSYRTYGGSLELKEDGTFSLRMGVSSDDPASAGTYSYEGGSEILLHFYDDSSTVCTKQSTGGKDTIIMPFDIFGDTFKVYFEL